MGLLSDEEPPEGWFKGREPQVQGRASPTKPSVPPLDLDALHQRGSSSSHMYNYFGYSAPSSPTRHTAAPGGLSATLAALDRTMRPISAAAVDTRRRSSSSGRQSSTGRRYNSSFQNGLSSNGAMVRTLISVMPTNLCACCTVQACVAALLSCVMLTSALASTCW